MEYIIDIGEGKGDFPPTPHATDNSNLNDESNVLWDIPDEAVEFAADSLKKFLISLSEREADCKDLGLKYLSDLAKSIVSKWEQEQKRMNDMVIAKFEEEYQRSKEYGTA